MVGWVGWASELVSKVIGTCVVAIVFRAPPSSEHPLVRAGRERKYERY